MAAAGGAAGAAEPYPRGGFRPMSATTAAIITVAKKSIHASTLSNGMRRGGGGVSRGRETVGEHPRAFLRTELPVHFRPSTDVLVPPDPEVQRFVMKIRAVFGAAPWALVHVAPTKRAHRENFVLRLDPVLRGPRRVVRCVRLGNCPYHRVHKVIFSGTEHPPRGNNFQFRRFFRHDRRYRAVAAS